MNKTPNYNLNQWEADDRVQRTDFNADNAKIDAALAGKVDTADLQALGVSRIVFGTYTGDKTASRVIDLGCQPKAVLVFNSMGASYSMGKVYGGLALPGHPVTKTTHSALELVSNGFKIFYDGSDVFSNSDSEHYYIAFL